MDRSLSGTTTPGQSGPGNDANEGVMRIPPKLQYYWNRIIKLFSVISRTLIPKAQRLSLWNNWEDERGCDKGHWHTQTRGLPWGLPEFVGTVQQVHCSWRWLLRRGLEFHVCTINKSAYTKKVWKLIVCTSYFYQMLIILSSSNCFLSNNRHLFALSYMVSSIPINYY